MTDRETFFIADTHFGHASILSYDDRPFVDIESHDEELIASWNRSVHPEDDVYMLGDISYHRLDKTQEILQRLNGNKYLIAGNHDSNLLKKTEFCDMFCEITNYKEIRLNGEHIVLSHYPIPCFNKHYYGGYHFYGHVHNSFEEHMMQHVKREMEQLHNMPCRMLNVGVMMPYMHFTPQPFITLKDILAGEVSL